MKMWHTLTPEEKEQVYSIGIKWYSDHIEHVDAMVTQVDLKFKFSYAPSGSDIFHPELWKLPHWRYFLYEYRKRVENETQGL